MKAVSRHSVPAMLVAASLVAAAGCAPRADHLRPAVSTVAAEWLEARPRALRVVAAGGDAEPTYVVVRSDVLADMAAGAAAGGLVGLAAGLESLSSVSCADESCAAVLVLVPIFAVVGLVGGGVYGAATAEPAVVDIRPAASVDGVAPLLGTGLAADRLGPAVRDRVADLLGATTDHVVLAAPVDAASPMLALDDAVLAVRVATIQLIASENDLGSVALRVMLETTVRWGALDAVWGDELISHDYVGDGRPVGAWLADDARPFRAELGRAVEALARQAVAGLSPAGPT